MLEKLNIFRKIEMTKQEQNSLEESKTGLEEKISRLKLFGRVIYPLFYLIFAVTFWFFGLRNALFFG